MKIEQILKYKYLLKEKHWEKYSFLVVTQIFFHDKAYKYIKHIFYLRNQYLNVKIGTVQKNGLFELFHFVYCLSKQV